MQIADNWADHEAGDTALLSTHIFSAEKSELTVESKNVIIT